MLVMGSILQWESSGNVDDDIYPPTHLPFRKKNPIVNMYAFLVLVDDDFVYMLQILIHVMGHVYYGCSVFMSSNIQISASAEFFMPRTKHDLNAGRY